MNSINGIVESKHEFKSIIISNSKSQIELFGNADKLEFFLKKLESDNFIINTCNFLNPFLFSINKVDDMGNWCGNQKELVFTLVLLNTHKVISIPKDNIWEIVANHFVIEEKSNIRRLKPRSLSSQAVSFALNELKGEALTEQIRRTCIHKNNKSLKTIYSHFKSVYSI